MKHLCCADLVRDCPVVLYGLTDEDVLQKAVEHERADHNVKVFTRGALEQLRIAIRDSVGGRMNYAEIGR